MSDIPSFPYRDLWDERVICSVANLPGAMATNFWKLHRAFPSGQRQRLFRSKRRMKRSNNYVAAGSMVPPFLLCSDGHGRAATIFAEHPRATAALRHHSSAKNRRRIAQRRETIPAQTTRPLRQRHSDFPTGLRRAHRHGNDNFAGSCSRNAHTAACIVAPVARPSSIRITMRPRTSIGETVVTIGAFTTLHLNQFICRYDFRRFVSTRKRANHILVQHAHAAGSDCTSASSS